MRRYDEEGRVQRARLIKLASAAVAALAVAPIVAACGSGYTPGTINIYSMPDGAPYVEKAADACNAASNGEYTIKVSSLPKSADDQRLQLARRLTGNDHSVDLMTTDVVWTAEFADAGWIEPLPQQYADEVRAATLPGPLDTATWKKKGTDAEQLFAFPAWTNTQLLWYRPDVLKKYTGSAQPPQTWDELLADNAKITTAGGPSWIATMGARYEGLMVWFNSVLLSAGGSVVDPSDPTRQTVDDTPEHRAATVRALEVLKQVATAPGHDPSISNNMEGQAAQAMLDGHATFEMNWPFVFAGMRTNAAAGSVPFLPQFAKQFPEFADEKATVPDATIVKANTALKPYFTWARYPGFAGPSGSVTSLSTIGGNNIAVASTSRQKDLAFKAAACLTNQASQRIYGVDGGTPPVRADLYRDKSFQLAYPMYQTILDQLQTVDGVAAVRPKTPVYQAMSTLIVQKLSPVGNFDPQKLVGTLADQVNKAITGKGLIP